MSVAGRAIAKTSNKASWRWELPNNLQKKIGYTNKCAAKGGGNVYLIVGFKELK